MYTHSLTTNGIKRVDNPSLKSPWSQHYNIMETAGWINLSRQQLTKIVFSNKRSSQVRMRSSLVRMRSSLVRMRSSLVVKAFDCHGMHQLQRSWVRSQHPSAQWNLRGGRWSSVDYTVVRKKNKKSPPPKKKRNHLTGYIAKFPTRNYLHVGIYCLLQGSPSENAVKSPIRNQTTSRNKNTVLFPNFTPQSRLKEISKMCSLLQETTFLKISSLTRNLLSEERRSKKPPVGIYNLLQETPFLYSKNELRHRYQSFVCAPPPSIVSMRC